MNMCLCTPNIKTPYCGKRGCEIPNQTQVNVYEKFAWILVKKRTGAIVTTGGIEFEIEENKCPSNVLVNPIYEDEYENIRVRIMNSKSVSPSSNIPK